MQKYTYVNFANLNPRVIVNTYPERIMRCKIVYFARQRFARAIIDVEALQSLVNSVGRVPVC